MKLKKLYCKALRLKRRIRHPSCAAVIVAAGSATRMRGSGKILTTICGEPVLAGSLRAFNACVLIDEIVVVARKEELEAVAALCREYRKVRTVVCGGASRPESVAAGISAVSEYTELVAVHDGARPFVTDEIICAAASKAAKFGGAAPAIPVKDTIKLARGGVIERTPERKDLFAVQTPQVFDYDILRAALQNALANKLPITDDCSAVEALGMQVHLTGGSEENIKITTPLDLELAETILKRRRRQCALERATMSTN